jgi:hypothetical protein
MEQPVPRQTLTDPDFYTEEYQWLSDDLKGHPCVFPLQPAGNWTDVTTTVSVSSAVAYESETVYELDKTLKLYPATAGRLNGKFVHTDSLSIKDESVLTPSGYGTFRVTTSDSETIFLPNP